MSAAPRSRLDPGSADSHPQTVSQPVGSAPQHPNNALSPHCVNVESPQEKSKPSSRDTGAVASQAPPQDSPACESHDGTGLEIGRQFPDSMPPRHTFQIKLHRVEPSNSAGSDDLASTKSPSGFGNDHCPPQATARACQVSNGGGSRFRSALPADEAQIREQALAAFANHDRHEPVRHYISRESDESECEGAANGHELLLNARKPVGNGEKNTCGLGRSPGVRSGPVQGSNVEQTKKKYNPWGKPAEAVPELPKESNFIPARPDNKVPLLGSDLVFPRASSPEPAWPEHSCSDDSEHLAVPDETAGREGLWHNEGSSSPSASVYSQASSTTPNHGLWGGCCKHSSRTPSRASSGVMPAQDGVATDPSPAPLPPTPPPSNQGKGTVDTEVAPPTSVKDEFGDDFVTQVYNYLSLGYPAIGRAYDAELSCVSGISIAELRQDDHLTGQVRGYLRLGPDGNLQHTDITEESCRRWQALRCYVRGWTKENAPEASESTHRLVRGDEAASNGTAATAGTGFGSGTRKGSWAR